MTNSNTKPVRRFSVARCEREAALAEAEATTPAAVDRPSSQPPAETPAEPALDGDGRKPSDCQSEGHVSNSKDLDEKRPDPLVKPSERPAEEPAKSVARREDGTLQPGSNLNPGGRNQWSERNQVRAALDTLAEDVPPESMKDRRIIWKRFIELVKRGDPWAVKEYFSRRWPVGRAKDGIPEVTVRNYTGLHFEKFAREQVNITVVSGIEDAPGSRLPKPPVVEAEKVAPVEAESAPESTNSPQPAPLPSQPEPELPVYDPNPSTWEIALPRPRLPSTAKFDPDP